MQQVLNPLVQKWIGTLVRTGLTAMGAYFVGQGWASTEEWTDAAMAISPIAVSTLWGLYQKFSTQVAQEAAKALPAGATDAHIEQHLEDTSIGQKFALATQGK